MLCVGVGVIEGLTDRSNETETRGEGGGTDGQERSWEGFVSICAYIRVCSLFVPTCVKVKACVGRLMGGWVWVR